MKEYQSAVDDFTAAIEAQPSDVYLYMSRAFAYLQLGKPREALADRRRPCASGRIWRKCGLPARVVSSGRAS